MTHPTQPAPPRGATALARPAITALIALNLLVALGIAALLIASVVLGHWPWLALGFDLEAAHPALPGALQAIAGLGLVGAACLHVLLRRLRAIVDSVRDGDPFIAANAHRLRVIAWLLLAGEVLRLLITGIAAVVSTPGQPVHMGEGFAFAPWLAVLLLFVLAGVFAQGARMRADLDGTV